MPVKIKVSNKEKDSLYLSKKKIGDSYKTFKKNDYFNFLKLKSDLASKFPKIINPHTRTGRSLENIYFFIWYSVSSKNESQQVIEILVKNAILLSAQDNFFDNQKISRGEKEKFRNHIKSLLTEGKKSKWQYENELANEVFNIWTYILNDLKTTFAKGFDLWCAEGFKLTESMYIEQTILRKKVPYQEYLNTSTITSGVIFIWSTYLTLKKISADRISIRPILEQGGRVVRIANDYLALHKGRKLNSLEGWDKENLVLLLGKNEKIFYNKLNQSDLPDEVKNFFQRFIEFLVIFYLFSDFDQKFS